MKRAHYIPIGWYQLKHQKFRMLAAIAGITFSVVLMLVQQGFRAALWDSSVRWHRALDYDLVMLSPETLYLQNSAQFPRVRLTQAAGAAEVASVTPVYMALADWRNPIDPETSRSIFVVGFDPVDKGFSELLSPEQLELIKLPDRILFDSLSRKEYGPIAELLTRHGEYSLETNGRNMTIAGLFSVGTSFGIDGSLITSDLNFRRMFPSAPPSHLTLGLMHLHSNSAPSDVARKLRSALPGDALILTMDEFIARELDYWDKGTPIGYVFTFGVIMGFVVGSIIVYQILYSDVQDHLREYATLKAMGYSNLFLIGVVLQEATILAFLGFLPGVTLTYFVFGQAAGATNLPLVLTPELAISVLGLTLAMCVVSGLIAVRKLRSADPADVF